jgi:hypothetical protein
MLARRPERLPKQTGLSRLGRWASVVALVAGMGGVSAAGTEASRLMTVSDLAELTAMVDHRDADLRASFGPASPPLLAVAADEDADNEEKDEEEEFEEDGLRPTGQAEQRDQKKGERSETKNEDSTNSTD